MKTPLFIAALASTFLGGAATAATSVTFSSYQKALNAGEIAITDFNDGAVPAAGFSLSGSGEIRSGHGALCARPGIAPGEKEEGRFLCLKLGQYEEISTPKLSGFSLYAGSLDAWNKVVFHHSDGSTESFGGADLVRMAGGTDGGKQTSPSSNGRYTFHFDVPVTSIRLSSSFYSFEVDYLGAALATPAVAQAAPATGAL